LARQSSVASSFTRVPVVVSVLPPGQRYTSRSASDWKSSREKVPSLRADLSNTVTCGSMPRLPEAPEPNGDLWNRPPLVSPHKAHAAAAFAIE
jgi:hypothetical protein